MKNALNQKATLIVRREASCSQTSHRHSAGVSQWVRQHRDAFISVMFRLRTLLQPWQLGREVANGLQSGKYGNGQQIR